MSKSEKEKLEPGSIVDVLAGYTWPDDPWDPNATGSNPVYFRYMIIEFRSSSLVGDIYKVLDSNGLVYHKIVQDILRHNIPTLKIIS